MVYLRARLQPVYYRSRDLLSTIGRKFVETHARECPSADSRVCLDMLALGVYLSKRNAIRQAQYHLSVYFPKQEQTWSYLGKKMNLTVVTNRVV